MSLEKFTCDTDEQQIRFVNAIMRPDAVVAQVMAHYTVGADRETGEWLGEPELAGDVEVAAWNQRADTDATHYDTFEIDGKTCAIEVTWAITGRSELAADTINGTYNCENPSIVGHEILIDMDFYNALSTLPEGTTIYGNVNGDVGALIQKDFGIR